MSADHARDERQARPFVILQDTKKGPRYFMGGYPELVDSWTPILHKAARFSGEQAANIREHCQSYTSGADCKKVRI